MYRRAAPRATGFRLIAPTKFNDGDKERLVFDDGELSLKSV